MCRMKNPSTWTGISKLICFADCPKQTNRTSELQNIKCWTLLLFTEFDYNYTCIDRFCIHQMAADARRKQHWYFITFESVTLVFELIVPSICVNMTNLWNGSGIEGERCSSLGETPHQQCTTCPQVLAQVVIIRLHDGQNFYFIWYVCYCFTPSLAQGEVPLWNLTRVKTQVWEVIFNAAADCFVVFLQWDCSKGHKAK